MIKLKESSFLIRRVYRETTEDDHDQIIQNTIIIARFIKRYRTNILQQKLDSFTVWKNATWVFCNSTGYQDFEDEFIDSPKKRVNKSRMSFNQSHQPVSRYKTQNRNDNNIERYSINNRTSICPNEVVNGRKQTAPINFANFQSERLVGGFHSQFGQFTSKE